MPNLGCRGTESPGWFHVLPKNSTWDMMHEQACCNEAANCQLLLVTAFWIIGIVSTEEWMFKLNAKFDADSLLNSVILHAMMTQYARSLNSVYHPPWLVQGSRHCSHVSIPVHSPWLPGYIDVAQTILVILTISEFFPDKPHFYNIINFKNCSCLKWTTWCFGICMHQWNNH